MPVSSTFEEQINALLVDFQAKSYDGISVAEAIELATDFTAAAMAFTAELQQPGAVKKDIVLRTVGTLFDAIAPLVVLPLGPWLQWLRPFVRPFLRAFVMQAAEGVIESIFKLKFQGLRT